MIHALAILAVDSAENTAEAPDGGIGTALIIGTILLVIVIFAAIFVVFTRTTRASRGGVQPPLDERDDQTRRR